MNIRQQTEEIEDRTLSPFAQRSSLSKGRAVPEKPDPIRTCFQRDRDRIIHSKAFRRLKGKTQVFVAPVGDHYRTRLTHTLEVSQVARTIAKALRLNEDLTEAVALAHDLGHTPFGHAGEDVLNRVYPGGFRHNEQSLRVVDVLERDGQGLNLTWEVRDGILNHPGERKAATLEGQIIKFADRIAYLNHDIDDAIRGGVITLDDIPRDVVETLGPTHGARIATLVQDVVRASWNQPEIRMSEEVGGVMMRLREFMFARVYVGSRPKREEDKARGLLGRLYDFYVAHPDLIDGGVPAGADEATRLRLITDYVAGMTDSYAIAQYQKYFLPEPWPLGG